MSSRHAIKVGDPTQLFPEIIMTKVIFLMSLLFITGCGPSRTTTTTTEKYIIVIKEPQNGIQYISVHKILSTEKSSKSSGSSENETSIGEYNLGTFTYDINKGNGGIEITGGSASTGVQVKKIEGGIQISAHETTVEVQ